jgi:allantoin racemase
MEVPARILLINPITTRMFNKFNEHFLDAKLSQGFEVTVENLEFGTETIESFYDEILVAPYVAERVLDAERRGFAAVIISCFMDPGLKASREVAHIPIVGPGESSMMFSLLLGDSFSILDVGAERYRRYTPSRQVRELGLESHFRSAWGTGVLVTEIGSDPGKVAKTIIPVAQKIQQEDEPDVLILGCTGLSTVSDQVSQALDIPVVDASVAALRTAEALVRSGWLHSRKAYPAPSKKSRKMPAPYHLYDAELVEPAVRS